MLSDAPKVLLSTSSFYFWMNGYDSLKSIEFVQSMNNLGVDGFDIYIDPKSSIDVSTRLSIRHLDFLSSFSNHCLHTDFFSGGWCENANEDEMLTVIRALEKTRDSLGIEDIVIHGDFLYRDAEYRYEMLKRNMPGARINIEVLGNDKVYATHPEHMLDLINLDSELYITPDLAHMQDWENDYQWYEIFEDPVLSSRIRIVHASHHTSSLINNWYVENGYPECSSAVHSMLLCDSDKYASDRFYEAMQGRTVVLEGIIPPVKDIQGLLMREKSLISRI